VEENKVDIVKIIYIDDNPDPGISYYVNKKLQIDGYYLDVNELKFNDNQAYEGLISDSNVRDSDIVIIDSKLFENDNVSESKFTGEEFKIILKKIYPYKEVIVISQNDSDVELGIVKKYSDVKLDEYEYYEHELKPVIVAAVDNIIIFKRLSQRIKENSNIEKNLSERILNSISGSGEYDLLGKEDIDALINEFKKLQVRYDG